MDPLSVTASIIAVLQLSTKVLGYLSDVKDASKDRAKCAIEAANAHSLLMNLRFLLEDKSDDASWNTAVRALGVENGPLDQFKQALEQLQDGMMGQGRVHQPGKALIWKFKKEEISSIIARIERLKTLAGIALEMDHFKLSKAIKEDTNIIRTDVSATKSRVDSIWEDQVDEKHKKLTEWISSTNYPAQQADIIARRQKGTGQWFLDAPQVAKWISEPKGTLFCPGIPGAGKTMVAAIAIDYLLKTVQSSSVGVAYVYCNYKAQEEQNASSILAAIVKQLVQSRPSLIDPVARLYEKHHQKSTKPSLDEISAILQEVIADFSTVHLVIDALDECKDSDGSRSEFLAKLQDLQSGQDVRLMATSRFIPEIEEEFEQAEKLEIRASDEDVKQFVDGQMYRLPKCIQRDPTLQQLVKEKIPERVDGMFLLARLHVDSLLDKTTPKKVKTALFNLSKGSAALDNAYKDALQRIESQLDGQCELAKKVLSWVTYAKRPLTTAELCCALAVEPEETELDPDNLPDSEDLLSICAGLVIIDQESAVFRLVHYTTQEYFERTMGTWNPGAPLEITSTCLAYLSFDTFQTGKSHFTEFEKRLEENVFLSYAAEHWGQHALMVENEACELVHSFIRNRKLVSCAAQVLRTKSVYPQHRYYDDDPEPCPGLHLAARFGLSRVIEKALSDKEQEQEALLERRDGYGETLLYSAVSYGQYRTTELLLEKGAQVDGIAEIQVYGMAKPYYRRDTNPLIAASSSGHEGIVELLLEKGAEPSSAAVHAAARKGHTSIVELLLEKGAEPSSVAVNIAASRGHASIVELLLEKGAEPSSAAFETAALEGYISIVEMLLEKGAEPSRTALRDAASEGHISIVELLLEKGAEPSSAAVERAASEGHASIVELLLEKGAEPSSTALRDAAFGGHASIVELLLEKAVEVNARESWERRALQTASRFGHTKIVKLLLEKGADVNAGNEHYSSALQQAAASGHKSIVELLLEKGADVNMQNKYYRYILVPVSNYLKGQCIYNALEAASASGHEEIVRLLLEKGANANARNEDDGSALKLALDKGHEGVARILRDAGACED